MRIKKNYTIFSHKFCFRELFVEEINQWKCNCWFLPLWRFRSLSSPRRQTAGSVFQWAAATTTPRKNTNTEIRKQNAHRRENNYVFARKRLSRIAICRKKNKNVFNLVSFTLSNETASSAFFTFKNTRTLANPPVSSTEQQLQRGGRANCKIVNK